MCVYVCVYVYVCVHPLLFWFFQAWEMFDAIDRNCKVKYGYAAYPNVGKVRAQRHHLRASPTRVCFVIVPAYLMFTGTYGCCETFCVVVRSFGRRRHA